MKVIAGFLRLLVGVPAIGLALAALAGLAGFASPYLDIANHFQLVLFFGLLGSLLLSPLIVPRARLQGLFMAVTATGFIASALIVVPEIVSSFAPRPAEPTDGRPVYRAMTHNLFGMNYDMQRMDAFIEEVDPDILVLQEFFSEQSHELLPLLKDQFLYHVTCEGGKRANIGLFAKMPFDQLDDGACAQTIADGERTSHIIAHFTPPNGEPFTFATTHFDWPLPVERQLGEFDHINTALAGVAGPLILAGDFNSTPWSYALRRFVNDGGFTRHTRNLVTFPMLWLYFRAWRPFVPFLALDHVLSRGAIAVHWLEAGPFTGSDHLPVVFEFSVGD